MLHTLWILFKFILILLAILLGLFLAVILLVLFCPVRYRAAISRKDNSVQGISADIRLSWLFGAVSLRFRSGGAHTGTVFYILGIPLKKPARHPQKNRTASPKESSQCEPDGRAVSAPHSFTRSSHTPKEESVSSSSQNIVERAEHFFFRLGSKCRTIYDHIILLYKNLEYWNTPQMREAVLFTKTQIAKLLKHVFPTKITGKLIFGCTDPAITGSVLALLGTTMPLHKNCLSVTPISENRNVLEGNIHASGRIRGVVLAEVTARLYFNQNIKYMIKKWKQKED